MKVCVRELIKDEYYFFLNWNKKDMLDSSALAYFKGLFMAFMSRENF